MTDSIQCPACLNTESGSCRLVSGGRFHSISRFDCDICGTYELTEDAFFSLGAGDDNLSYRKPEPMTAAILSYKIRSASSQNKGKVVRITPEVLDGWRSDAKLPSRAVQAENLIRFIGDSVSSSGEDIDVLPEHIHATVGARNYRSVLDLLFELEKKGITKCTLPRRVGSGHGVSLPLPGGEKINLTLEGWERYEDEKRGQFSANYGFIAMQFGDPDLDSFVKDVVRRTTQELGYDLVDMRDVARAGVIDNIMRTQIRDSAFVIADLTHDNSGAYWEAGYAEGLGKPVIYICERTKFDDESTHFDTNHCTTVPWSKDDPEGFSKELIATLRRSLEPD